MVHKKPAAAFTQTYHLVSWANYHGNCSDAIGTDQQGPRHMGSVGLVEPINFERKVLEPIKFEEIQ